MFLVAGLFFRLYVNSETRDSINQGNGITISDFNCSIGGMASRENMPKVSYCTLGEYVFQVTML